MQLSYFLLEISGERRMESSQDQVQTDARNETVYYVIFFFYPNEEILDWTSCCFANCRSNLMILGIDSDGTIRNIFDLFFSEVDQMIIR